MTITFIGHGYVGLVTACVFADLGNTVYVIGRNKDKLDRLEKGDPIIFEPGLSELLKKNLEGKRIIFTTSYKKAIPSSDVVFIAVGTPPKENGEADLSTVLAVAEEIGPNLKSGSTVVSCKSTVPVGTNRKILGVLEKTKSKHADVDIASCPEFLREGSALQDTFSPDRIVIGADSPKAVEKLLELHKPLQGERVVVGIESAELIKYASNSLLATKISFANMIAMLCEKTGANVVDVLEGVGLDKRLGHIFLDPGVGYGGSCFPKDVKALIKIGQSYGADMNLLQSVEDINQKSKDAFVAKIKSTVKGKKIGLWGLAFKPNTDDIREAPAIYMIRELLADGFEITAYDPEAMENTKTIFGNKITFAENPYDAARNSEGLIIATEWNEFKQIDLEKVHSLMKTPTIIDGRNMYDPKNMKLFGFMYISVGR